MTPATAAAVSLLERLRTLAETWTDAAEVSYGQPTIANVPGTLRLAVNGGPERTLAVDALRAAGYYDASERGDWIPRINGAIAALKGETK